MINVEDDWEGSNSQYATRPNADPLVEVSSGKNNSGILATKLECYWGQILHCFRSNL